MATLIHDDGTLSTNFATAFGALPQISIHIDRSDRNSNAELRVTRHTITIRGTIIPSGATVALQQANITDKLELLVALADGTVATRASLTFTDNGAVAAWSYDGSADINFDTLHGLKIIDHNLPHGPADYVTHKMYYMIFACEVMVCTNDPISGIGSYAREILERWDASGLVSIAVTGELCKCSEEDNVRTLFETLRDTIITPEIRARFVAAGIPVGTVFGPTLQDIREKDKDKVCIDFSLVYGGGNVPEGSEASSLQISAQRVTQENGIKLSVTGVYGFRGPMSTASAGSPVLGGFIPPLLPGLPAFGGGGSSFVAVKREAERHDGILKEAFFPTTGAGACYLDEIEELVFDGQAHTITATRHYLIIWRHDHDITDYQERITISNALPTFQSHPQTYMRGEPPDARVLPYCQWSGHAHATVSFEITITSLTEPKQQYTRLPVDHANIWQILPFEVSLDPVKVNVHGGAASLSAILPNIRPYTTRTRLTYAVRDMNVAALKAIRWFDAYSINQTGLIATTGGSPDAGGFP